MISDLPFHDIFVPQKLPIWKNFDDVVSCDLWFRPPTIKNSGYANELKIALKKIFEDLFFLRTLAPVSLVLGLGLEHSCPWPREVLSSERLSLASRGSFLGKAVLGLERFFPRKGCPWPRIFLCSWPRALCPRLHLWQVQ